ncbi:O-antigen ligase family protein [Aureimonas sp. Leaf454]|uniref:O-antigen ligase family protein n=1 Tax=Aureimonas sp. Leaf454 TaxID=1736381 RepID=UPI000A95C47B|nr:O-antigen ligase family protein [Aureimonas sp. Leaf454]
MSIGTTLDLGRPASVAFRDRYVTVLLVCIAAYAFTGKGFAYAGVPPLFPAELLLLCGLVTLVWPMPSAAFLCTAPSLILLAMIVWTLGRTIPYVGAYKIDALRDSVIVVYGLFAFVVANLILEKPARIDAAVGRADRFFLVYGAVAFLLYIIPKQLGHLIPAWPVSGAPMMLLRGGEVAVHIAGAAVFALVGLRRFPVWWVGLLILGIMVVSAQSRGGMLAIAVPIALATLLSGRYRPALATVLAATPIFAVLYLTDVEVQLPPDFRTMRAGQLLDNVTSIFASSSNSDLDGTKIWRIRWWQTITDYTLHGDYFWTGKGFGINLAMSDGFVVGDGDGPPLRSPHSAHMTILARSGVPGLVLWIALNGTWLAMMVAHIVRARLAGDEHWAGLLIFVTCYLVAGLVNASFDVALEGPMMGVIFWVLFGAGIGLCMTYRTLSKDRDAAWWRQHGANAKGA